MALLVGPAILTFFSGGFFDEPRLWAALGAWLLVIVAAVIARDDPLPASTGGRLALSGLALLTAWTCASIAWSPLAGSAVDDAQRTLLYLGAFTAACLLLRGSAVRWAEPALAGGATAAAVYGLSERLLPGLFELERSTSAEGRLDQPLTYWNASGALAALGLVLCVRLAGDHERPRVLRAAAAAAAPITGLAMCLSVSRGAIAACVVGIVVLVVLAPTRAQVRAAFVCLGASVVAGGTGLALTAVRTLEGSHATAQGLVMLAVLIAAAAATAALASSGDTRRVPIRRGAVAAVLGASLAAVAIAGVVITDEQPVPGDPAGGPGPGRLTSVESDRYEYWKVAARAFADHPLEGTGTSGFRVEWLRERTSRDPAKDAHSLYVETASELGLIGLAALALFLAGVALSARAVLALRPAVAAGPVAALVVWAVHAAVDWDWEMPGVTLPALLLAGTLVAAEQ